MAIRVKRAYEAPSLGDGYRVLVDRVWPRGVKKDEARIDAWLREIAPSTELRKWFGHDPDKWNEFKSRYFRELADHQEALKALRDRGRDGSVTLVFGAKDEAHNNAVALKEHLDHRGCG
jgi:uncharacterized protein YeaO (DUF488 family)